MKSALILTDGAKAPEGVSADVTLLLATSGPKRNLRLSFDGLEDTFLQRLPPPLRDLLRLAAYIYGADTRIPRGTASDVFAENWPRQLKFCVAVEELALWSSSEMSNALRETLEFLTGDSYEFFFEQGQPPAGIQGFLDLRSASGRFGGVDSVVMFSGGADSLAATLEVLGAGGKPLLVSHRPTPPIDRRQQNLIDLLRERFPTSSVEHASMVVNRQDAAGRGKFEPSQRSRSFLFTALGATCAALLEVDDLRLCDNGIVSINLPRLDQSYGSMLSRSTHPRYLREVQALIRLITQRPSLSICNALLLKTKQEVMESIAASGFPELIQETVSCAHVEGKTKHQPHCGVCSQCIDRRFATIAGKLTEHDLASRYEIDVFAHALLKPLHRLQAESYVRFARRLEEMSSASEFLEAFPELYDCLPDAGAEQYSESLHQLFQRHQKAVNAVIEAMIAEKKSALRRGTLPETCLLRMVCLGTHAKDPRFQYVERLKGLLCGGLRPAFQTVQARNERHVQDVSEGLLKMAKETLAREVPMLPFATVATKPDFSDRPSDSTVPPLFVEFKYVKNRKQLNKTVTEITSRVEIYRKQGAWSLFVVYDPSVAIVDDQKFTAPYADDNGVWIGIAR